MPVPCLSVYAPFSTVRRRPVRAVPFPCSPAPVSRPTGRRCVSPTTMTTRAPRHTDRRGRPGTGVTPPSRHQVRQPRPPRRYIRYSVTGDPCGARALRGARPCAPAHLLLLPRLALLRQPHPLPRLRPLALQGALVLIAHRSRFPSHRSYRPVAYRTPPTPRHRRREHQRRARARARSVAVTTVRGVCRRASAAWAARSPTNRPHSIAWSSTLSSSRHRSRCGVGKCSFSTALRLDASPRRS